MTDEQLRQLPRHEQRAYYLGRVEEANFWIDKFSSKKSAWAKTKLKEAKALRDKDIEELKKLG